MEKFRARCRDCGEEMEAESPEEAQRLLRAHKHHVPVKKAKA